MVSIQGERSAFQEIKRVLGAGYNVFSRFWMTTMRFSGIAFTLAFMFVGFFVGVLWNDLTTAVRPSLQILRDNWRTSDIYLSTHPLETGIIFAVASAAIVPLLVTGRRLIFVFFRRISIMDLLFRNDGEVHYIASHMRQTTFQRIGTAQIIELPTNAPLLPSSFAISTAALYAFVAERYHKRKKVLLHFDNDNWGAESHSFVSIGGPFVNEVPKYVLDRKLVPKFTITDVPTAIDDGIEYKAEREGGATSPEAPLSVDYGFVIIIRNPWDTSKQNRKRLCIVFGLWPQGTQAAFAAMLGDHESSSAKYRQLYRAVARNRDVIAIVRVSVRGMLVERGQIVKVRLL
jgi:hypothetical protein